MKKIIVLACLAVVPSCATLTYSGDVKGVPVVVSVGGGK